MGGTPVNTGFEFKLADGSVVKAENVEEAFKTVAKMKEDTSAALREERKSREDLEARLNTLQAEVAQRTPPPSRKEGEFDKDGYFRMVGEDPVMANRVVLAHDLGLNDPNQVPQVFQEMYRKLQVLEGNMLAASFINSHPEFPGGTKEAELLTKEAIRLQQLGHPTSMDTLELAWRNCVESEQITPVEQPQETEEPNPSLSGGGAGTVDAESARIEQEVMQGKMSTADLEKYLRSKGLFG